MTNPNSEQAGMAALNRPLFGSVTQGTRTFNSEIGEKTLDHFTITLKSSPSAYNDVVVNMDFDNNDQTLGLGTDTAVVRRTEQPNSRFPHLVRIIGESQDVTRTLNNQLNDFLRCSLEDCSALRPASLPEHGVGGYEIELIDWTTSDDGFYLGGGVWTYDLYGDFAIPGTSLTPGAAIDAFTFKPWGAFVDGDEANLEDFPLPTTGDATYTGQTYVRIFTLPVPSGSTAIQTTIADMNLWVRFSGTPTISGEVRNFNFRDFSFPNLRVLLGEAEIDTDENHYEDDVTSTGLLLDEDDASSELKLSGKWGGRFYGTPPNVGDVPLATGGTWGADGTRGDPENGGFRLTLLGAFGLKPQAPTVLERPVGVDFKVPSAQEALDVARQTGFADAAGGTPRFDGAAATPVTQGGSNDRVFLTRTGSDVASLTIDVGNAGTATLVLNATGTAGDSDSNVVRALAGPGNGDRRLNTRISGGADDPSWDYQTRRLAISTDERTAITERVNDDSITDEEERLGDGVLFYEADIVDWTDEDDGYYMAGGVWSYYHTASLTADIEVTAGAFIDGDATDITANPLPTTGTADYEGHSYGRYTTLPVPSEADINAGHFAATASLTADFGAPTPQVSGRIENFLFSPRGTFEGRRPELQSALRRTTVYLGNADITGNRFDGATTTNGVFLDRQNQADQGEIELTGTWAGRFFGAAGDTTTPEAPPAVGGTWGAAGGTDLAPEDGGFSISFIGSFGAKR